ncbi:hypothetical protein P175DRAFT_01908 [Aspergillus ochraceoroseus IBT 24754]|uniref:Saposin B-type domain-containing protein n=3 Tax=Aspergillus subgen. Nidulantes TaxID=2720870 RepID=A0A0F8WUS9_9EURO|nr:uncharacterized protein P175DRAFT_01908 [Aspergillus ochraceoroseus IBT 24754]KKK18597.1 hypothetical protein AOCH_005966 [Aspergillus ochraceoroseus]KKK21345.1 hypothetical protein ARAM_002633 [Aspergillus rambellii]PTU23702.1 hypothetical protein P175DRAFT_01908 [Aspergillus ochraceoroseus IBT 24754]
MKQYFIALSLAALVLMILGGGVLYSRHTPKVMLAAQQEDCADCVNYAGRIDTMFRKTENVQGNPQFFRYALDVSCRGTVLASGQCLNYRRQFLKDPERFMQEVQSPYDACISINSCL